MSTKTGAACHQYADDTGIQNLKTWISVPLHLTTTWMDKGWTKDTNLIFNPNKTKSILFTTQQMAGRHQFDYSLRTTDCKEIEHVSNFKLLGITFNENLKWNAHVKRATASAYGSLKTLTCLKKFLSFSQRKQLAEALVLSRLDYGNVFLFKAPAYLHRQLQRVQNAAASFAICWRGQHIASQS